MTRAEYRSNPRPLAKMTITEDELRSMVVKQRMTDVAIGKQLGVCNVTVLHWRQRFEIKNAGFYRERTWRTRGRTTPAPRVDPDQLREMYATQGMSQRNIGEKFGVSQVTVSHWLGNAGIQTRPASSGRTSVIISEGELRDLYIGQEWTMGKIAEHFKCGESTVRQNLIRYGLQLDALEVSRRRIKKLMESSACRYEAGGYARVRAEDNPKADSSGYVYEHQLVVEQAMGRPLAPGEQVHHINLEKLENQVENLAVLPGRTEHALVHKYMERAAAYLCGLTKIAPAPLAFGMEIFWGGRFVREIDLLPPGAVGARNGGILRLGVHQESLEMARVN